MLTARATTVRQATGPMPAAGHTEGQHMPDSISHTITLTAATFDAEIARHPGLAIVDFSASWCAPCRAIAPILERIAAERADVVKVATLDMDADPRVAAYFGVRAAPTLLFFKDGTLVARIVGAVPRARIEAVIDAHARSDDADRMNTSDRM